MNREVVFLTLSNELFQPFSHHFAFPADYRPLENRQALIRHNQILIDTQHLTKSFAYRTGTQRVVEAEHHIGRFDERNTIRLELL